MAGDYVSLNHIIERLQRIKLPEQEFNIADIKEWCYIALRKIGITHSTIVLDEVIEIIDGVGKLPYNYEKVIDIYEYESGYQMMELNPNDYFKTMSYKIQSGYIYTDFPDGKVYLHYNALAVDKEGLPLVPNTEYYISAVESYLRFMIGTKIYWQRKIVKQELDMLEREWLFYCAATNAESKKTNMNTSKRILQRNFPTITRNKHGVR